MKAQPNLLSMAGSKLTLVGAILLAGVSLQAQTTLQLDFTQNGGPYTVGWTPVYANFLADTPTASVNNINGLGYNFSISHVGVYDNGNVAEPLTRSGFYTFGNNANDHSFTLSGLVAGQTVDLYASAAWDGNGRGGVVVFGNSGVNGVQAQTIGDPGTSPTLANLTLIGTATVDLSGMVQGSLNGSGGVGTPTEGQLGGMMFVISAVPEPGSFALIGLAIATFAAFRRKS